MALTSEQVLTTLREGNDRFVRGQSHAKYSPAERSAVADVPHPMAVIVGCADSRVPIEAVFDLGVGDAFVVRSAGQVLADPGLASVRFGVEQWGIPLVVVLGHEDCLAVRAAVSDDPPKWLQPITDYIASGLSATTIPIADGEQADLLPATIDQHVRASVTALETYLRLISLPGGPPPVVGGTYRPSTGEVRWLD